MQHQCTAALVRARQLPHCSLLLCKPSSQDACVTAIKTYGDLLFIQVCSDATPMHCITVQGKTASPLFCAALQTKLTGCLCHCNYTYGDLVFTQVCSDATPMHPSTGHGKTAAPLFSAALQTKLTAKLHLWSFALHTGVQRCNTNALHHWSGQDSWPIVHCCSANQADSKVLTLQSLH